MKKIIKFTPIFTAYFLYIALITASSVFLLASDKKLTPSEGNAKIIFSEDSHDFGKVEQGQVLEYSFIFINEGEKLLVVEKVQPSCGCTGATTGGKNEYSEGESGEIKITFNTQGRVGHQEKHVTVITNDTEYPKKDLKFSCDIETATK